MAAFYLPRIEVGEESVDGRLGLLARISNSFGRSRQLRYQGLFGFGGAESQRGKGGTRRVSVSRFGQKRERRAAERSLKARLRFRKRAFHRG